MTKLLLDDDYAALDERDIEYIEVEQERLLVLSNYPLPEEIYDQDKCDVIVVIPANYNQDGNDMFWTFPRLTRSDGSAIPNTQNSGDKNNRTYDGREFCRWSRHWNKPPATWRAGKDDVLTILRRLEWAFRNPDADK